jgi:oxygen-independent coproporphyrinogen-3 oxidase
MVNSYSLYFHVPFCRHRCAYCDFNTYAGQEELIPAYVKAVCREVEAVAASIGERLPAHTVFFGGGTPSLLAPEQTGAILAAARAAFALAGDAEISLEANPGTLMPEQLQELRALGVNRLSFGVQAAHADELQLLERIHDFQDVVDAVAWARAAGFDNLNLDLIYGLPNQSLARWQETVERALSLQPEHLSLYALTIEHGTPFGRRVEQGLLPRPDPDEAASMLEFAAGRLPAAGYSRYEISNWARDSRPSGVPRRPAREANERKARRGSPFMPGFACRHNLTYWRNLPYLGFGAGAHGCAGGYRVSNVLRIQTYLDRILQQSTIKNHQSKFPFSPATVNHTRLSLRAQMQETMMLGLRLTEEGISADEFRARFGVEMVDAFGKAIDELVGLGLLERFPSPEGSGVRLTPRGREVGNQVFMRFV